MYGSFQKQDAPTPVIGPPNRASIKTPGQAETKGFGLILLSWGTSTTAKLPSERASQLNAAPGQTFSHVCGRDFKYKVAVFQSMAYQRYLSSYEDAL